MTLVALIDGPLSDPSAEREDFRAAPAPGPAGEHAAALAAIVRDLCPSARLLNLVVFAGPMATDAPTVARALARAAERAPAVALCAFGMRRRDDAVAAGCARLLATGCVLVASAPARSDGPVYPAALPGVVAVQGDARCAPQEWSRLELPGAAFGACPRAGAAAGASVAAAHLAGHLAARLAAGLAPAAALAELRGAAAFRGRERRAAGEPAPSPRH